MIIKRSDETPARQCFLPQVIASHSHVYNPIRFVLKVMTVVGILGLEVALVCMPYYINT